MAYDFKKEYKEFYLPPKKPGMVTVPPMNYIAVRGKGDPNDENGEYKAGIGSLYAVAFTIRMSYKGEHRIKGFFEYVVPPLEGLWRQEGKEVIDYTQKKDFEFISMIRLPDFVSKEDFDWAVAEASEKKNMDLSGVEFFPYNEGECVQCMHIGSYDDEPKTIAATNTYIEQEGYALDLTDVRRHPEIYLSDPRRCDVSRLRTVVRQPVQRIRL